MFPLLRPALVAPVLGVVRTDALRAISSSSLILAKRKDSTLPHVPKASPSPYALYVKDYFARESENLKSGGGKIHISEISSKIADEWKSLPDGEKAKYETTAKQLRTSYESELKTFLSTLSSTDKAALKTSTGKSMKLPVKLRGGEGERKRPLSAFFEFLADMRKTGGLDASVSGSNKVTSFAKAGGDRWKSMSEGEKKRYYDIAAGKKATYDSETGGRVEVAE